MKELKGRVTISRVMDASEETPIWIDIKDENSHVLACRIKITLEQYAKAITGLAEIPCSMEFNDSGLVGKIRIRKSIIVPHSKNYFQTPEETAKHIAENCPDVIADGWEPYLNDFNNQYRHTEAGMTVNFTKYVDPDSQEAKAEATDADK